MAEEAQPTPEEQFLAALPEDGDEVTKPTDSDTQPDAAAQDDNEGSTATAESFTRTDLDSLLDGISDPAAKQAVEAAYKSFQGDYTRKTQELSAAKAALGDNPEEAQEALEFYSNLRTDPAFALEVHEYLSDALQQLGLTKEEADTAASDEVQRSASAGDVDVDADDDPSAPLKSEISSLQERLDRWEQQDQERQAAAREDELAATLLQQEMTIREQFKGYKEKDFDRIYDLAVATGGNLIEANNLYQEMRNDTITEYIGQKGAVTDRVDSPSPSPAQALREIPHDEKGNVDLESVHKAAMQTLFNHMAEREAHG
jgi:hypothetical protein